MMHKSYFVFSITLLQLSMELNFMEATNCNKKHFIALVHDLIFNKGKL